MEINRTEKTMTITQNTGIAFSVSFLLMLIGAVITGAVWVVGTQNRIDNAVSSINKNTEEIAKLKASDTSNQIKFTEIQTQLRSIGTSQDEMKIQQAEILKELRNKQ